MSLRGKDFRGEIDADLHDKLRRMAEFQNVELSALGAQLLEKMIAAEWHAFSVLLDRLERSGIVRKPAENGGTK
ncbi:MAG: hypothetical protein Q8P46_15665 [Hyphomicrobiales bacterium]|nr:hypothetical protein [Hyphomicrobiales bacterium]